ncbi:MAG: hypothetical protein L6W00_00800 [Lentisphaeria bacterium]|nr:MAG: hypothetical protein L6W00_00800 [Lentisphaeria bacterium]
MFFYTETVVNFPYFISSHKPDYGKLPIIEPSTVQPTPGEVKSHIVLCLAIAALAKNAKCASTKNQRPFCAESAKYDMRVFLLRLGLIGPEFKKRPHAPPQAPAGEHGMEARQTGRTVKAELRTGETRSDKK